MDEEAAIRSLESRVNKLHGLLYSKEITKLDGNMQPIDVLEQAANTVNVATIKHGVFNQVWKRLDQLSSYLDTDFMQRIGAADDDTKYEIIVANESRLRDMAQCMQELQSLQSIINQDSLKNIPVNSSKLEPLIQIHLDQKDEQLEVNAQIETFLTAYNNIISTLSKQFIYWNNLVTQCELAVDMNKEGIE